MAGARIIKRTEANLSQWVRLVTKEVVLPGSSARSTYHSVAQADYVTVVARLPDGRLPIVRQFRPAVERETWELPAGLLDGDEAAENAARRELLEETGAVAINIVALGAFFPCTGRLENRIHVFAAQAAPPAQAFASEPGVSAVLVSPSELRDLILAGEFSSQLHLGALALAELKGFSTGVFA